MPGDAHPLGLGDDSLAVACRGSVPISGFAWGSYKGDRLRGRYFLN